MRVPLTLVVNLKLRILVGNNQNPARTLEPLAPVLRKIITPLERTADIARGDHAESLLHALHILLALDDDNLPPLLRRRHNAIQAVRNALYPCRLQTIAPSKLRLRIRTLDLEGLRPVILHVPARLVKYLPAFIHVIVITHPFPVAPGFLFRPRVRIIVGRYNTQPTRPKRRPFSRPAIVADRLINRLGRPQIRIRKQVLHLQPHRCHNRVRRAPRVTMHQDLVPGFAHAQTRIRVTMRRTARKPPACTSLDALKAL